MYRLYFALHLHAQLQIAHTESHFQVMYLYFEMTLKLMIMINDGL